VQLLLKVYVLPLEHLGLLLGLLVLDVDPLVHETLVLVVLVPETVLTQHHLVLGDHVELAVEVHLGLRV